MRGAKGGGPAAHRCTKSATWSKSASTKPREVRAGVPIRRPPGTCAAHPVTLHHQHSLCALPRCTVVEGLCVGAPPHPAPAAAVSASHCQRHHRIPPPAIPHRSQFPPRDTSSASTAAALPATADAPLRPGPHHAMSPTVPCTIAAAACCWQVQRCTPPRRVAQNLRLIYPS